MVELLGFQITRAKEDGELKKDGASKQAFTIPTPDDGTTTISAGGYFGQYLDMEVNAKNDSDLIRRYREVAQNPECDMAIEDIINEAIVVDDKQEVVRLNVNNIPFSAAVKKRIGEEFENVINYFKDLTTVYILFYEKNVNNSNTRKVHINYKHRNTKRIY